MLSHSRQGKWSSEGRTVPAYFRWGWPCGVQCLAHALSHFDLANNEWLYCKHDELIDRVMKEEHVGKCRLMLNILSRQQFEEEFLRSDFIDFCVSKITACAQPDAIRAYCMKLAYEQMMFYPELLSELKMALDMLEQETLSPGLASAKRQILMKIKRKHSLS